MEAVTARNVVAGDLLAHALVGEAHATPAAVGEVGVADLHLVHPVQRRSACGVTRGVEVTRDLGLAVDHDGGVGMGAEIHPHLQIVEAQHGTLMGKAMRVHPRRHTCLLQKPQQAVFENARANATQDVIARAALQHDGLDAALMTKLGKQQPRGTAADDTDLCAHARPPLSAWKPNQKRM